MVAFISPSPWTLEQQQFKYVSHLVEKSCEKGAKHRDLHNSKKFPRSVGREWEGGRRRQWDLDV